MPRLAALALSAAAACFTCAAQAGTAGAAQAASAPATQADTTPAAQTATAAQAATDPSFLLTATGKDLDSYFPTYLANGYLSTMTAPRGTESNLA